MKKIFSAVIVLAAVAMVSCGGNATKKAATDAAEVKTEAAACDKSCQGCEGKEGCCAEKCDSTACCEGKACCDKKADGTCCEGQACDQKACCDKKGESACCDQKACDKKAEGECCRK